MQQLRDQLSRQSFSSARMLRRWTGLETNERSSTCRASMINVSIVIKGFLSMSSVIGPRANSVLPIEESSARYSDVRMALAMLLPLRQCTDNDSATALHIQQGCPQMSRPAGMRTALPLFTSVPALWSQGFTKPQKHGQHGFIFTNRLTISPNEFAATTSFNG